MVRFLLIVGALFLALRLGFSLLSSLLFPRRKKDSRPPRGTEEETIVTLERDEQTQTWRLPEENKKRRQDKK